jgi:hypothetical protein
VVTLRNYELYAGSANPLVGASVSLYAATAAHPNPGAVLSTTLTDTNGMWQFTGLATATYDVKVTAPGAGLVKWYKGLVDIGIVATLAGQITTTEILDGTIKTADLEANAVTQIAKSTAVFAGPSYGGAPPQHGRPGGKCTGPRPLGYDGGEQRGRDAHDY